MAQPEYVPLSAADRVRPAERLPAHGGWRQTRPAEITSPTAPRGRAMGSPGPDQGYALTLAKRFEGRLELTPEDHLADAIVGCAAVGMRRAALFGRAPVIYDMELAYTVFGFLGGAPPDLIEFRVPLFQGASHDYWDQRVIVDKVKESTLRSTPEQVRQLLSDWRSLFVW